MALQIFSLVLLLLSTAAGQTAATKAYAYAGFNLETDWQSLTGKFPRSSHEFLESYSGTTHLLAADGAEAFQQAIRSANGKYRIRLAESEAIGGIYFLEFDMAAGKTQALKLSFEKPDAYFKKPFSNQDERFPACGPILSSLSTQYGKPANSRSWAEEALEHNMRTWQSAAGQLSFDCGQYMGRKKVFALEVTIAR
jgi:hypothetical protein